MTADRGPLAAGKSTVEAPATPGVVLRRVTYPFVRRLRRLAKGILMRGMERLPSPQLESFIYQLVARRMAALPADEALCFLFRLDMSLYTLQGQKAVEYDEGIHTKHRHTRYHDFFVGRIRSGERVLDIGCGNGAVAYDIAEKAEAYVTGIDLSSENIQQARSHYSHPRVRYILGDALRDLPSEQFDVVIMSNVLGNRSGDGPPANVKRISNIPLTWL